MRRRVFIVHGYQSAPDRHWFPWLQQQLAADNIYCTAIALPESQQPDFAAWQQALAEAVGSIGAHDYFVGHSLGCITLLHYLSSHAAAPFGGLVLAAGFSRRIGQLPELDGYIDQARPDFNMLASLAPVYSIISDNDSIIPPSESLLLAERLHSPVHMIPNGGHLMGDDGITELPAALAALRNMMTRAETRAAQQQPAV